MISNELRARIFAPYVGAARFVNNYSGWILNYGDLCSVMLNKEYQHSYIELKLVTSITEEDAMEVAKLWLNKFKHPFDEVCIHNISEKFFSYNTVLNGKFYSNYSTYFDELNIGQAQYLQSKGYALPLLNYSVDDLVNLKVIKLVSS